MLERVRNTVQTNPMLKLIHDAHEKVVSKTAEIAEIKKSCQSKQPELTAFTAALNKHIAQKKKHVEQVHMHRAR